MKTRVRFSIALLVLLVACVIIHWAFVMLNAPSDIAVGAGAVLALMLFILTPTALYKVLTYKGKEANEEVTSV